MESSRGNSFSCSRKSALSHPLRREWDVAAHHLTNESAPSCGDVHESFGGQQYEKLAAVFRTQHTFDFPIQPTGEVWQQKHAPGPANQRCDSVLPVGAS